MVQLKGESCDDYIEKILRQAIRLAMPNEQSLHAIINGLQPSIKMYVYAKTLQHWKSSERPPNWLKIQKCNWCHRTQKSQLRCPEWKDSCKFWWQHKHQKPLHSTPGNVQSAPSITLHNHHPLVEFRSLTTIARRLLQQATYNRRSSASTQTSKKVTVTPTVPMFNPRMDRKMVTVNPSSTTGPRTTNRRQQHTTCHRCYGMHDSRTCRFKTFVCNYCHRSGHIRRDCRFSNRHLHKTRHNHSVSHVSSMNDVSNEQSNNTTLPLHQNFIRAKINHKIIYILIDTGSMKSCISRTLFQKFYIDPSYIIKSDVSALIAANGQSVSVSQVVELIVNVNELKLPFTFLIVDQLSSAHHAIIGFHMLSHYTCLLDMNRFEISFYDGAISHPLQYQIIN